MAQARFTATISPPAIGKNETAELRLMIENASQAEQIVPPSLKDFIVLSGPNQESGMETVNGVTKQYTGITFIIKPKRKGNLFIGAATAKADGKILKTNTVSLQVSNSTAAGGHANNSSSLFNGLPFFDEPVPETDNRDFILKKGENIPAKINKNIFIKATADKASCFIGEPVVLTYKLYTRLKSESDITKNPSFNGFSVIDLTQPGSTLYDIEKLGGIEYNVYTLRKAQLYPLQAGDMEAGIAEVENTIHFVKEEFLRSHQASVTDVLNGMFPEAMQDEKVTIQSKPVMINVKPLPDINKPLSFKGAVGNFKVEAAVKENHFNTDDAGKLAVVITGQGNMELINAPDVTWPPGIEGYEPTITESLNRQNVPVSGSKSFEFPFTVSKAGTYTLPAVEYSYFDAVTSTYKTITTKPIIITVAKGTGKALTAGYNPVKDPGKERFFDIFFTNRLFVILLVAVIIFAGLFFWLKKENKKEVADFIAKNVKEEPVVAEIPQVPVNPLVSTEHKLVERDCLGFYETLNKELRNFLASRLVVPMETINKKRIAEELDKKGVTVSTSLQVQQLLDAIEWQLYTPCADESKMEEMYQAADSIVHSFNDDIV